MKILINKTVYEVIDVCKCCNPKEVCILQTFDYADGLKRQLKIWTQDYQVIEGDITKKGK